MAAFEKRPLRAKLKVPSLIRDKDLAWARAFGRRMRESYRFGSPGTIFPQAQTAQQSVGKQQLSDLSCSQANAVW